LPRRRQRRDRWVLRRLAAGLLIMVTVSVIVFGATQALPGDAARAVLGSQATPERLAALRAQLGLDRPVPEQYWGWVSGLASGDLGTSLASGTPVGEIVSRRLSRSLVVLALAAAISFALACVLGVLAAARRDRLFDRALLLQSLVLVALPEFVIGMLLVILFATAALQILPAVALIPPDASPLSHPRELVLPVLTLVLAIVPYLFRLIRGAMIDILDSPYVEMARLKGLPERTVLWRHALPNGLVPAIQASAIVLVYLLGGTVIVETLFGYPGLGAAFVDAVAFRDIPLIQALAMLFAAGVVLFNLLADVLTVYVTPRLRTAAADE
jgi:peptide/nickel transport system permease protein